MNSFGTQRAFLFTIAKHQRMILCVPDWTGGRFSMSVHADDTLDRAYAAIEACLKAFAILLPTGLVRSAPVCAQVASYILTQFQLPFEIVYGYKQLQEGSWSRAHMWLESPSGAITDFAMLSIHHSIQILGQTFNFSGDSVPQTPFYGSTDVFIVPPESPKMDVLKAAGAALHDFVDTNIKDVQQRAALRRVAQTCTQFHSPVVFEGVPFDMLNEPAVTTPT